ncbi:MAG: pyridoxamine 5'-phosphate oxidase family protein [Selenomonadaceae bacterium]|nr:pyridoxamine 5'-phosphate oxidase family protein [Selenomonadaceae bacterium]
MFREMRRKRQQTSDEEARAILASGTSGVLALSGDDGYNYAVPISYAVDGDKIYFHSALSGHKLDSIRRNDRVSFCVIAQDEIVPERFTTYFKSAIAFGRMRIIIDDDDPEKRHGLELLMDKYSPTVGADERDKEMSKMKACAVPVLDIEHLTGKVAKELVTKK